MVSFLVNNLQFIPSLSLCLIETIEQTVWSFIKNLYEFSHYVAVKTSYGKHLAPPPLTVDVELNLRVLSLLYSIC